MFKVMQGNGENRRAAAAIFIAALVVFGATAYFRFHAILADPDLRVNWSGDFFTDEGWHSGNAVTKIMTGHWLNDERNLLTVMPVVPVAFFLIFKVFGASLFTARSFVAVSSLVVVVLSSLMVYSERRAPLAALLNLFLTGTNYSLFIFSRVALLDIPMIAFGMAGLAFYLKSISGPAGARDSGRACVSGLLLAIAMLTKPSAVIFLSAVFAWSIVRQFRKEAVSYLPVLIPAQRV